MMRNVFVAGAITAALLRLSGGAFAGADDYVFVLAKTEIKSSNVATIAVRLVNKATRKPVTGAALVRTRFLMAHDGGAEMDSTFEALPSPEPGVFAFRAPLTMAGKWSLSIAAKVPGESEAVAGKLAFRVIP